MNYLQPEEEEKNNLIKQYLSGKYNTIAGDNSAIDAARSEQKNAKVGSLIAQGLNSLVTARGKASGYQDNSTNFFSQLGSVKDDGVDAAKEDKKNKLESLLMGDKLDYQDVERGYAATDQKSKADDSERKKVTQGREDESFQRESGLLKAEDDPKTPQSELYRRLGQKMRPEFDFTGMSATQIKSMMSPIEKTYSIDEQRKSRLESAQAMSGQRAEARSERSDLQAERMAESERLRQEKKDESDKLLAVPGYERDTAIGVKPETAEKMRTAASAADAFDKQLEQLIAMQSEYGDYETGPVGAEMQQLAAGLQLQAKELENLGVLSGPDLQILRSQIPDVGNSMTSRNSNTAATLKAALKSYRDRSKENMKNRGYKKIEKQPDAPAKSGASWKDF
jgi:hypothetical protein